MICKVCGTEASDADAICLLCGSELLHDDADVDVAETADIALDGDSKQKVWPWDAQANTETNDAQTNDDSDSDAAAEAKVSDRKHFDFRWESDDFHVEQKTAKENIRFEWGSVFGEKKPEAAKQEEPKPDAPKPDAPKPEKAKPEEKKGSGETIIGDMTIDIKKDDERFSGSIFGYEFFGSSYTDPKKEEKDKASAAKESKADSIPDAEKLEKDLVADNSLSNVEEPTIRISASRLATTRDNPVVLTETPKRDAPFRYEPRRFEPYKEADAPVDSQEEPIVKADAPADSQKEPIVKADTPEDSPEEPIVVQLQEQILRESPISSARDFKTEPIRQVPQKDAKPAYVAGLDIFDSGAVSPFELPPEDAGVVSPFDFTDASIASLFGSSDYMHTGTQTSFVPPTAAPTPRAVMPNSTAFSDIFMAEFAPDLEAEAKQAQKIQEIVNRPVVFPFDDETGYSETIIEADVNPEPEPEDVRFDAPEDETVTYTEPGDEDPEEAPPTQPAYSTPPATPVAPVPQAPPDHPTPTQASTPTAPPASPEQIRPVEDSKAKIKAEKEAEKRRIKAEKEDAKDKKLAEKDAAKDKKHAEKRAVKTDNNDGSNGEKKKHGSALVVIVNVLIVVAVIVVAAFIIMKFAPDSVVAKKLDTGITKVTKLLGISVKQDKAADKSGSDSTDSDTIIAPNSDKDALVSAQAGFINQNIAEVVYDKTAIYDPDHDYSMSDISHAQPIQDDYWTADANGVAVLYDEAAVYAVIKYNSNLVSYIDGQQSDILSCIEEGSKEQDALAQYASSLTSIDYKRLGIGEVLSDGTYLYVFTKESVVEKMDNTPSEVQSSKVYKLVPDALNNIMKITEIETVS